MQTSNAKQNFRSGDPLWVILAEHSLADFLSDYDRSDEPTAGLLCQTLRELGMPLECVGNIAMLVTEFTKESPEHYKPGRMEFPARIRIFCQKKMIDNAHAARATSRTYHTEQATEHSPMILDFGTKMDGGWGFFLIQRGANVSDDSHLLIDLYLYREG